MKSRSSLNHIFRTVWNQALGAMVAVAEIATGRGQGASSGGAGRVAPGRLAALPLCIAVAWGVAAPDVLANPTGGVVIQGQATFNATQANKLLITTQNAPGTNQSAINWQSFSIPVGNTTYFQQPGSTSTSINRVVTNTPTQLFGTLGSNGNLVLVNQSGITVGAGAVVDTAGFTASALNMTEADALAGKLRFGDGSANGGAVSVQGNILARGGDVV
jgi:filamentous hemagglutinin family protein